MLCCDADGGLPTPPLDPARVGRAPIVRCVFSVDSAGPKVLSYNVRTRAGPVQPRTETAP